MSRSNSQELVKKTADQYHHGDLRRTLLDAARELATEQGIDSFTLREVARRAGVSHAAPYHHFADKAALVEALTAETYNRLTEVLSRATKKAKGTALDRLTAIGIAYVEFAVGHPAEFRLLARFGVCDYPGVEHPAGAHHNSPVEQAASGAYALLIETIDEGQEKKLLNQDRTQALALTCWAAVHGLATLILDGLIRKEPYQKMSSRELAKMVVLTLKNGLAIR